MNISYKRNSRLSYMIIEGEESDWGYKHKMILENDIDSILSGNVTKTDGKVQYWFDITGKKSLSDILDSETIDAYDIKDIFEKIKYSLENCEKYLIDKNSFIISADMLFLKKNEIGWQVYLCCCPIEHDSFTNQMRLLLQEIVSKADNSNIENTGLYYEALDAAQQPDFIISDITNIFERVKTIEVSEEYDSLLDNTGEIDEEYPDLDDNKNALSQVMDKIKGFFSKKKEYFYEKEVIGDFIFDPVPAEGILESTYNGATTFLSMEDCFEGTFVYKGNSGFDDIVIDTIPFNIGSKPDGNNGVIPVSVISRHHARITEDGGSYYLEDLNSKNGTFLNGDILEYKEVVKLKRGDMVSFADIPYQFI